MNKTLKQVLAISLIPVLLCLAACNRTGTADNTEPHTGSAAESTPGVETVDKLANINEMEPNAKGVYQIKFIEGIN